MLPVDLFFIYDRVEGVDGVDGVDEFRSIESRFSSLEITPAPELPG